MDTMSLAVLTGCIVLFILWVAILQMIGQILTLTKTIIKSNLTILTKTNLQHNLRR